MPENTEIDTRTEELPSMRPNEVWFMGLRTVDLSKIYDNIVSLINPSMIETDGNSIPADDNVNNTDDITECKPLEDLVSVIIGEDDKDNNIKPITSLPFGRFSKFDESKLEHEFVIYTQLEDTTKIAESLKGLNSMFTCESITKSLSEFLTYYVYEPYDQISKESLEDNSSLKPILVHFSNALNEVADKIDSEGIVGESSKKIRLAAEEFKNLSDSTEIDSVKISTIPLQTMASTSGSLPDNKWMPTAGRVSSVFGMRNQILEGEHTGVQAMHYGIDIATTKGTPVRAVRSGKVVAIGRTDGGKKGYGNCVTIQQDDGYQAIYAHLDSISVSEGNIKAGDLIGGVGNTGNSRGFHLHFEIRKSPYTNSKTSAIEPSSWIVSIDPEGKIPYISGQDSEAAPEIVPSGNGSSLTAGRVVEKLTKMLSSVNNILRDTSSIATEKGFGDIFIELANDISGRVEQIEVASTPGTSVKIPMEGENAPVVQFTGGKMADVTITVTDIDVINMAKLALMFKIVGKEENLISFLLNSRSIYNASAPRARRIRMKNILQLQETEIRTRILNEMNGKKSEPRFDTPIRLKNDIVNGLGFDTFIAKSIEVQTDGRGTGIYRAIITFTYVNLALRAQESLKINKSGTNAPVIPLCLSIEKDRRDQEELPNDVKVRNFYSSISETVLAMGLPEFVIMYAFHKALRTYKNALKISSETGELKISELSLSTEMPYDIPIDEMTRGLGVEKQYGYPAGKLGAEVDAFGSVPEYMLSLHSFALSLGLSMKFKSHPKLDSIRQVLNVAGSLGTLLVGSYASATSQTDIDDVVSWNILDIFPLWYQSMLYDYTEVMMRSEEEIEKWVETICKDAIELLDTPGIKVLLDGQGIILPFTRDVVAIDDHGTNEKRKVTGFGIVISSSNLLDSSSRIKEYKEDIDNTKENIMDRSNAYTEKISDSVQKLVTSETQSIQGIIDLYSAMCSAELTKKAADGAVHIINMIFDQVNAAKQAAEAVNQPVSTELVSVKGYSYVISSINSNAKKILNRTETRSHVIEMIKGLCVTTGIDLIAATWMSNSVLIKAQSIIVSSNYDTAIDILKKALNTDEVKNKQDLSDLYRAMIKTYEAARNKVSDIMTKASEDISIYSIRQERLRGMHVDGSFTGSDNGAYIRQAMGFCMRDILRRSYQVMIGIPLNDESRTGIMYPEYPQINKLRREFCINKYTEMINPGAATRVLQFAKKFVSISIDVIAWTYLGNLAVNGVLYLLASMGTTFLGVIMVPIILVCGAILFVISVVSTFIRTIHITLGAPFTVSEWLSARLKEGIDAGTLIEICYYGKIWSKYALEFGTDASDSGDTSILDFPIVSVDGLAARPDFYIYKLGMLKGSFNELSEIVSDTTSLVAERAESSANVSFQTLIDDMIRTKLPQQKRNALSSSQQIIEALIGSSVRIGDSVASQTIRDSRTKKETAQAIANMSHIFDKVLYYNTDNEDRWKDENLSLVKITVISKELDPNKGTKTETLATTSMKNKSATYAFEMTVYANINKANHELFNVEIKINTETLNALVGNQYTGDAIKTPNSSQYRTNMTEVMRAEGLKYDSLKLHHIMTELAGLVQSEISQSVLSRTFNDKLPGTIKHMLLVKSLIGNTMGAVGRPGIAMFQSSCAEIGRNHLQKSANFTSGYLYPTVKMFIIEEDNESWYLYDDIYSYSTIVSLFVHRDRTSPMSVAVVKVTNLYNTLSNEFSDQINYEMHAFKAPSENSPVNSIVLRPGCRIKIQAGNTPYLDEKNTIFTGTVTSIQQGQIVTIEAQSHGSVFLSMIAGDSVRTYGDIDKLGTGLFGTLGSIWASIKSGAKKITLSVFGHSGKVDLITKPISGVRDVIEAILRDVTATMTHLSDFTINPHIEADMSGSIKPMVDSVWDGLMRTMAVPELGSAIGDTLGFDVNIQTNNQLFENVDLDFEDIGGSWWDIASSVVGTAGAWVCYNETAWDALQEVNLLLPNHILTERPYDTRGTLVWGGQDGYYRYKRKVDVKSIGCVLGIRKLKDSYENTGTKSSLSSVIASLKQESFSTVASGDVIKTYGPMFTALAVAGYFGQRIITGTGYEVKPSEWVEISPDDMSVDVKARKALALILWALDIPVEYAKGNSTWIQNKINIVVKGSDELSNAISEKISKELEKTDMKDLKDMVADNGKLTIGDIKIEDLEVKVQGSYLSSGAVTRLLAMELGTQIMLKYGIKLLYSRSTSHKRISDYHIKISGRDIVRNEIALKLPFNTVQVTVPERGQTDLDKITKLPTERDESPLISIHYKIKPWAQKVYNSYFKNANALINARASTISMVGTSILTNLMKDTYGGNLVLLGDPTIMENDKMLIWDENRDMFGLVGVKTHTFMFSPTDGCISIVEPDMIVRNDSALSKTMMETGYTLLKTTAVLITAAVIGLSLRRMSKTFLRKLAIKAASEGRTATHMKVWNKAKSILGRAKSNTTSRTAENIKESLNGTVIGKVIAKSEKVTTEFRDLSKEFTEVIRMKSGSIKGRFVITTNELKAWRLKVSGNKGWADAEIAQNEVALFYKSKLFKPVMEAIGKARLIIEKEIRNSEFISRLEKTIEEIGEVIASKSTGPAKDLFKSLDGKITINGTGATKEDIVKRALKNFWVGKGNMYDKMIDSPDLNANEILKTSIIDEIFKAYNLKNSRKVNGEIMKLGADDALSNTAIRKMTESEKKLYGEISREVNNIINKSDNIAGHSFSEEMNAKLIKSHEAFCTLDAEGVAVKSGARTAAYETIIGDNSYFMENIIRIGKTALGYATIVGAVDIIQDITESYLILTATSNALVLSPLFMRGIPMLAGVDGMDKADMEEAGMWSIAKARFANMTEVLEDSTVNKYQELMFDLSREYERSAERMTNNDSL